MSSLVLSRLRVSRLLAVKHRLSDFYAWHRFIWRAFNPGDKFQFRINGNEIGFEVLTLSTKQPQDVELSTGLCWDTKRYPDSFFDNSTYCFSLRAVPSVWRGPFQKEKRRPLTSEQDIREWIERKLSKIGYVDKLRSGRPETQIGYKGKRKISFISTDFDGILKIESRDALRETVASGIGPEKTFGFGLLLVRPC